MRKIILVFLLFFGFLIASEDSLGGSSDLFGSVHPLSKEKSIKNKNISQNSKKQNISQKNNAQNINIKSRANIESSKKQLTKKSSIQNVSYASNNLNHIDLRQRGDTSFIYSIALLSLFFDDGVEKTGYAVLLKDGYMITTADLVKQNGVYVKTIYARMQDYGSNSLMCVASLTPRAINNELALLQPISYTDKYCNERTMSFYHERINVKYAKKLESNDRINNVVLQDMDLFYPIATKNDTLQYGKLSLASINKRNLSKSLPIFTKSGTFIGIVNRENDKNYILTSSKIKKFVCNISDKSVIGVNELSRECKF